MQPPWHASMAYQFDMCGDSAQQGHNLNEGNTGSSVQVESSTRHHVAGSKPQKRKEWILLSTLFHLYFQ